MCFQGEGGVLSLTPNPSCKGGKNVNPIVVE